MIRFPYLISSEDRKKQRKEQLYDIGDKVMSFFYDEGEVKHGFEQREGQQDMAFEILDAIKNQQHIVIEAGVGIGKSFAYLVPLLYYNQRTGKPVIIATSTIALQEQLMNDVNRLKPLLKVSPEVILAKGQTHYLCKERANQYLSDKKAELRKEIKNCINDGCMDRNSFPIAIPQKIWDKINIQRYEKKACGTCRQPCAYRNMRLNLKVTNGIILCNQDFLTAHLMSSRFGGEGLITGMAEIVVVDEAHNLEDKVRSATTTRFSRNALNGKIRAAQKSVKATQQEYVEKEVSMALGAVRLFFDALGEQVKQQIEKSEQDMKYAERFFFDPTDDIMGLLDDLADRIGEAAGQIDIYSSLDIEHGGVDNGVGEELMNISLDLSDLRDAPGGKLIWIEQRGKDIELVCCPKDTNGIIRSRYFRGSVQTILTSATLTYSNGSGLEELYSYFIRNTGFPCGGDGVLSEPKPSPYPYDEHAMIYYCDDLPHPTREREAFLHAGAERVVEILKISSGKALVLFTAKTDMEGIYRILCSKKLPYKILMQQPGASQDKVLSEFREDVDSVLLGTGAYWEGISIEGKSLSNLIIFRLPFPVPDPIIEYKASVAKDPLMEVQVPEMITKLKQGIGRLIRNYTDTGIVSIIDPRLSDAKPARYRDITWDSLPIKNRTSDIKELAAFYAQLQGKPDEAHV